MNITEQDLEGDAYQNFSDYMRSPKTQRIYNVYLKAFLDVVPREIFLKNLDQEPDEDFTKRANQFILIAKSNTPLIKQIIKAYVRELKSKVSAKEIKPSTIKTALKPIKALLASNEIDFSWKLIDKGLPLAGKSQDRAYTREELQRMILGSTDIADKVIVTIFSATGIRTEAWDFLHWNDIVIFYDEDKLPKGMAIRVYAGDAEEYWTHGTPEAAKIVLAYKESLTSRFGHEPKPTDPFLNAIKSPYPKRLRYGGVRSRVIKLLRSTGIRGILEDANDRHEVPADHGFRKFNNTMCRRAKVDFADKEELQGRTLGQENSYGKYVESDFELWVEYQKAIPFLTIDETERSLFKIAELKEEKVELKKQINENEELKEQLKEERQARVKFENEMKETLAELRKEKTKEYN